MQTSEQYKRQTSIKVRPVQRSDQYKGQTSTMVRPVQRSDQYKRLIVPVRLLYQSPTFVPVRRCTVRSLYRRSFVGPTFVLVPGNGFF